VLKIRSFYAREQREKVRSKKKERPARYVKNLSERGKKKGGRESPAALAQARERAYFAFAGGGGEGEQPLLGAGEGGHRKRGDA